MVITYAKFKSAVIEQGKRILTVLQFGPKTAKEAAPFGFDSQALANLTAIYLETSNVGESVIVGYINENQLAAEGEARVYAVDAAGHVVSFVWAKNDGSLLLNGDAYTGVRFSPLGQGLADLDQQINSELLKLQAAISSLGGSYIPDTITTNIDQAESTTVKLK